MRLVLFVILGLTLLMLAVKVYVGWSINSLSLLVASLHTLIACYSIVLNLFVCYHPERPTGHQIYGHRKSEVALTLFFASCLTLASLKLLGLCGEQLNWVLNQENLTPPVQVDLNLLQLLGGVMATHLSLALLCRIMSRKLNNATLRFNEIQLFQDAGLTFLVIAALGGLWLGGLVLDLALAILLIFLLLGRFWQVLNSQLPLMVEQTAIAPEALTQIARQVGGVTNCYDVQSRGVVGRLVYIQMHLTLHPEFQTVTSLMVERIEEAIRHRYGPVQVTFYIDEEPET